MSNLRHMGHTRIAVAASTFAAVAITAGCGTQGTTTTTPATSSATSTVPSTPSSPSPSSTTPAPLAAPVPPSGDMCRTANLAASISGSQGGAGHTVFDVRLTNNGPTCTLTGYPGASLVGGNDGTQLGAAATRTPGDQSTVRLASGGTALTQVQLTNALNYPQAQCQPSPADGFRIFPPGETASLFIRASGLTGCASESVSILAVKPVQAG